jgi:SAM-dependent MidA family methyltransferase
MGEISDLLRAEILAEIRAAGPIPFARFMELCLYHPRYGYYTRGIGGGGGRDYLTSSGTHRVYGEMLARQAEEMWRKTDRPQTFTFVEFGPGEGIFACDFLRAAAGLGDFGHALEYLLVEPSPALRERQRRRLDSAGAGVPIEWIDEASLHERTGTLRGCLFANEVIDAFPVHRIIGSPAGPREIHVGLRGSQLSEEPLPPSSEALTRFLDESGIVLEEGQEADLNLQAPAWVTGAVGLLERGYLVVVDYGHEAKDLYHPARRRGTLLAYHRHRVSEDFLLRPGEQDLTAHVDFTALSVAARAAGARRLGLVSQSHFLLALGALERLPELSGERCEQDRDGPSQGEILREREAIKELVLPDRMGGRFRVLIVGVGDVTDDLEGLAPPWRREQERADGANRAPGGQDGHPTA